MFSEAAMGLGRIDWGDAFEALADAYSDTTIVREREYKEGIVAALGQRDIMETGDLFQAMLDDKTSGSEICCEVIEAVGSSQGNTTPFLLRNLCAEDSEVRASVAWALAVSDEPGRCGRSCRDCWVWKRMQR